MISLIGNVRLKIYPFLSKKSAQFMHKQFFTLVVIALLMQSSISAKVVKVSTLVEFNSAVSAILPGDSIVMRKGEWIDVKLVFKGNGTAQKPITLTTELDGKTVITGNSNLRIFGNYLIVDGLYFKNGSSPSGAIIEFRNGSSELSHTSRLTNTAIVNYNPSSTTTDYKWVSLYGTNNRVDHCYFAGKNHLGALLVVWLDSIPDYHRIDHNYFGYRPEYGDNGAETIRIGTSDWSMYNSRCTVENNYFEECDGEIEIISNKSCENIYRYNTFYRSAGTLTLRHGNRCEVYGNIFLGADKASTGGVRIIGEDHTVYNNYFANLKGTDYFSALTMVNGVPNSPLNRYFQVKNAVVAFNTFVNNRSNFAIGAGKSSEQSLPPLNCKISNNIVQAQTGPMITYTDTPLNMGFEGNIMFGASLGIPVPPGITITNPLLSFGADSVWRITQESPALNNSSGLYTIASEDFEGQLRDNAKDAGCDEYSQEPVTAERAGRYNTGPRFLNYIVNWGKVIKTGGGIDSLKSAIYNARSLDRIELTGEEYINTEKIVINKELQIAAAIGTSKKPVIYNINSNTFDSVFEIAASGSLQITGVELTGNTGGGARRDVLIKTQSLPLSEYYFTAENCSFKESGTENTGQIFRAEANSVADSISFKNCLFTGTGGPALQFNNEALNSGRYNVKKLTLENSTFWKIGGEAAIVYGGDSLENTPGPSIYINHCTFDSVGTTGTAVLNFDEVHTTEIKNSIFSNSRISAESIRISGAGSAIFYCDTFRVGKFVLWRNASASQNILGEDPKYVMGTNGNYYLAADSPLRGAASDGRAMGDLRWEELVTDADENSKLNTQSFFLGQNYPNPFNPSTRLEFVLPAEGAVKLEIYDIRGRLVATVMDKYLEAGSHSLEIRSNHISAGIYFYRLSYQDYFITKKMIVLN